MHKTLNTSSKSFKDLLKQVGSSLVSLEGQTVEGIIRKIHNNIVYVDVGLKKSVKFIKSELVSGNSSNELVTGSSITFYVSSLETYDGDILLNFEKAQKQIKQRKVWKSIEEAHKLNKLVNGRVLNHVNGGYSVGIGGIVAFLPNNQVNYNKQSGSIIKLLNTFLVLKINSAKKNIIVSRNAAITKWNKGKTALFN